MLVTIVKKGKVAEKGYIVHTLVAGEEKEVNDIFGKRLMELGHAREAGDDPQDEDDNKEKLEALKEKAMKLEIKFHTNIGMEKLKAKIEAKEKALPTLENKAITNLNNK